MEALAPLRSLRPALAASLRAASGWFRGMANPRTHRLHYAFEPAEGRYRDANSPIRDCGTAGDLAVLQRALGAPAFDDVLAATLRAFEGFVVHHSDAPEPWWVPAAAASGRGGSTLTAALTRPALLPRTQGPP